MTAKAVYLNGKLTSTADVYDRALQFGDGLFETIAVKNGQPALLQKHLARLSKGLATLNIQPVDIDALQDAICKRCAEHPDSILKLIVSRGVSERGYLPDDNSNPNIFLYFKSFHFAFDLQNLTPIKLGFAQVALGTNPVLAGIKHLNRLEQVLGKIEAQQKGFDDCLMLDQQGHVIESTSANVFLLSNNELYTPSLDLCGIQGVVRSLTIDVATELGFKTQIKPLQKADFLNADAVFVTNAINAIMPVGMLEDKEYSVHDWPINLFQEVLNRVYTS